MPKDIELGVRLTADGKGFVGAITVSDKAVRRLRGATDKAAASTRGMAGSMRQAESAAKGAAGGFLAAHGRLAAYASGALGIHQVARALLAVRDNSIRQEQALAQVEARRFPRTRGDRPTLPVLVITRPAVPPHTRG